MAQADLVLGFGRGAAKGWLSTTIVHFSGALVRAVAEYPPFLACQLLAARIIPVTDVILLADGFIIAVRIGIGCNRLLEGLAPLPYSDLVPSGFRRAETGSSARASLP